MHYVFTCTKQVHYTLISTFWGNAPAACYLTVHVPEVTVHWPLQHKSRRVRDRYFKCNFVSAMANRSAAWSTQLDPFNSYPY